MHVQHLQIAHFCIMSEPEWIALESIEERTSHFIFDDSMLRSLERRGLVEADGEAWRVTHRGQRTLSDRTLGEHGC